MSFILGCTASLYLLRLVLLVITYSELLTIDPFQNLPHLIRAIDSLIESFIVHIL